MKRLLLLCLLLPVASVAIAQRPKTAVPNIDEESRKGEMARAAQKKANERFTAADEDKSGTISREEAAKHFAYIAENWDRYDKNKDGVLSWEEFVGHDKWKRQAGE
jgi:Ca2+-binding EF-hand superfamily protein